MESTADTGLSRKLAQYLEKLPEPALLKLAYGLEREKLRGTQGLPFDELISALRPLLATVGGERPGLPDPMRHFCQPFEDLLVTDGVRPGRGQISRSAIALVWAWLENDLLPDALPDLCRHVTEKTLEGDKAGLEAAVSVMHASASRAMLLVGTLTTTAIVCPAALQWRSAARVSAVSPDCEMNSARPSFGMGISR